VRGTPGSFDMHVPATNLETYSGGRIFVRDATVSHQLFPGIIGQLRARRFMTSGPCPLVDLDHVLLGPVRVDSDCAENVYLANVTPAVPGTRVLYGGDAAVPRVVRNGWNTGYPTSPAPRTDTLAVGVQFTVREPATLLRVGRRAVTGNTRPHTIRVYRDGMLMVTVMSPALSRAYNATGEMMVALPSALPVMPGETWRIVSDEGTEGWLDAAPVVRDRDGPVATLRGVYQSTPGGAFETGSPDFSFAGVLAQFYDTRLVPVREM
jgi:hypothetical protein